MGHDETTTGNRLTECDACGGLAYLQDERPFYLEPTEPGQPAMAGHAEDIRCPCCGRRTQLIGKVLD